MKASRFMIWQIGCCTSNALPAEASSNRIELKSNKAHGRSCLPVPVTTSRYSENALIPRRNEKEERKGVEENQIHDMHTHTHIAYKSNFLMASMVESTCVSMIRSALSLSCSCMAFKSEPWSWMPCAVPIKATMRRIAVERLIRIPL